MEGKREEREKDGDGQSAACLSHSLQSEQETHNRSLRKSRAVSAAIMHPAFLLVPDELRSQPGSGTSAAAAALLSCRLVCSRTAFLSHKYSLS